MHIPSAALSGLIALGIFLDFYLWDVDGDTVLVQSLQGFQNLLTAGFTTELTLGYSFGLQIAGEWTFASCTRLKYTLI